MRIQLNAITLFRIGTALVALHVADDTLMQPPAGTSAVDHLASGLIPLGLLGAAAVLYARLGSGAQGLLALATGLFGIVTATEAVYYASEVGPSGDDFTGLLAVPAGLGLICLGAVTLWRGRRLDQPRPLRYGKRALVAAGSALVVATVVFPIALGYVMTHVATAGVPEADLGAAYEDVTFTTTDELQLEGWYVPSRNGAAVVVFPGRDGPQKQARRLVEHGYGVLLMDRRGEGASDGTPNAFGWGGERDVEAAVAFLRGRDDVEPGRIGGLGFSVGGEMMIQAAAEDHDLFGAVVSEGAGARSYAEDTQELEGFSRVATAPFLVFKTASTGLFSDTLPPPSLLDLIPKVAPTPLLLISSAEAPNEKLAPRYAELAGEGSTHWAVPGDHHIGGIDERPAEYERRVVSFFDRELVVD
jgi:dienelactone hydrolase